MSDLTSFDLPAFQQDLSNPAQQQELQAEWSASVNRWTETALLGNPWTVLNDENRDYYYNPLTTDVAGGTVAAITWTAFPNRILVTYGDDTFAQQMTIADGGPYDGQTGPYPAGSYNPPPPVNGQAYRPQGPRGWQDEYCEWNVRRDTNGNVTSVDFTCENPEYWFTLWRINQARVLELYQQLVDPSVQLEDLYLLDNNGAPVVDRETGLPAYNPTNKWNTAMSADAVTGAVHLISPPNTLGAEIYLAAAATLLRDNPPGTPVTDPETLINCSLYGTPNRNSDPHIGASVNSIVRGAQEGQALKVSLANPVGLYIQMPDFSSYQLPPDPKLPSNAQPSDCWQILRGQETISGFPNFNFILHARFALPQSWIDAGVSFTVGDITIQGNPIVNGAQITQTFQIGLLGLAVAPSGLPLEQPQPCVNTNPPDPLPAPQQLQDMNLFLAGSTSTAVTKVEQGTTTPNIAFLAQVADQNSTVTFPEGGVTAEVTNFQKIPGGFQLFTLSITAEETAALGDRSVLLTNSKGVAGPAAPGLLSVVPPGSLGQPTSPPGGTHAARGAVEAVAEEAGELNLDKIKLPTKRY